ncbi:hypothetical protein AB0C34_30085 [Nocardia sp. NPDC049220]|uniref:hypothetical protein n=1 Tax=Nocardia sp. NPDC049220 TaxID=3155273 RepID=UPI0033E0DF9F
MAELRTAAPSNRSDSAWFGPSSLATSALTVLINVLPVLVVPFTAFSLVFGYGGELLAASVLMAIGGRARQVGTGLIVALAGTLGSFLSFVGLYWVGH